jgi:large subunit ribosomal protein L23
MSIIKRPIISEKSVALSAMGVYCFEVALGADKEQIKAAVKRLFNVDPVAINTSIARGKSKLTRRGQRVRARKFKKAFVQLAEGQKIPLLEGV